VNIKSSLNILSTLATRIKWISETSLITEINKEYLKLVSYTDDFFNIPYSISVSGICQDLQIIYSCSFIDEYEKLLTPIRYPNEAEEIIRLKNIVKPAYKKIKSWKDLKKLRNYIIAHNLRINGQSIFDLEEKIVINAPRRNGEYVLLAKLIFLITQNFQFVFPEIMKSINPKDSLLNHIDIQSEKTNSLEELRQIEQEIENNKRCY